MLGRVMPQSNPAYRIEQVVRGYIQACNEADRGAIAACFMVNAIHYRPGLPKWSGAGAIAGYFAKRVAESGQWWTVDQILTDADRSQAVLEWTRFDPQQRQIVRGIDWFVFDQQTFLIREVRPYFAVVPSPDVMRHEHNDFDYAGRGYPVDFPER
jgi:SnoaL-like protein